MTDPEIRAALVDRTAIGLTLWGEARSEPLEGRAAIAGVIRNRLANYTAYRAFVETYASVCLAPSQFSCWAPEGGRINYAGVMAMAERLVQGFPSGDPLVEECLWIADGLMSGALLDRTSGATHYITLQLWNDHPPTWATSMRPIQTIGAHIFLKAR